MGEFGVAVKAMIVNNGKFLIIKKSSTEDVTPDSYDIPGGRVEFGESLEEALTRELKEEVNLTVEVFDPTNTWSFKTKEDFQLVGITFFCRYKNGDVTLSDEHVESMWKNACELLEIDLPKWLKIEIKKAQRYLKNLAE